MRMRCPSSGAASPSRLRATQTSGADGRLLDPSWASVLWPERPCPLRARSTGTQRLLKVASGLNDSGLDLRKRLIGVGTGSPYIRLENRYGVTPIVGSNPTPSAPDLRSCVARRAPARDVGHCRSLACPLRGARAGRDLGVAPLGRAAGGSSRRGTTSGRHVA